MIQSQTETKPYFIFCIKSNTVSTLEKDLIDGQGSTDLSYGTENVRKNMRDFRFNFRAGHGIYCVKVGADIIRDNLAK